MKNRITDYFFRKHLLGKLKLSKTVEGFLSARMKDPDQGHMTDIILF